MHRVKMADPEEEEEEEYDARDDDIVLLPTRRSLSLSPSTRSSNAPSSSRSLSSHSTIRRRSPMMRLREYVLDVCDAEDSLPDDVVYDAYTESKRPQRDADRFFIRRNGQYVLRVEVLGKIVSLLRSCAAAASSDSSASSDARGSSPADRSSPEASSSDAAHQDNFERLLKILHRCMDGGRDLDPFASMSKKRAASSLISPTAAKRKRSSGPLTEKHPGDLNIVREIPDAITDTGDEGKEGANASSLVLLQISTKLATLEYSALAALCAFMMLTSQHSDALLCSDDRLLPCIQVSRSIAQNVILPFVSACSDTASCVNSSMRTLLDSFDVTLKAAEQGQAKRRMEEKGKEANISVSHYAEECRHHMRKSFDTLQQHLAQIHLLASLSNWSPSETTVSILTYSIMPIFAASEPTVASSTASKSSVWSRFVSLQGQNRSLLSLVRIPALHAMQSMYMLCSGEQKTFVINAILDYLGNVNDAGKIRRHQYGLENGKSIHSITALLLQLIQGTARRMDIVWPMVEESIPSMSQQSITSETNSPAKVDVEALRRQLDEPREIAKQVAEGVINKMRATLSAKTDLQSEGGSDPTLDCIAQDLLETFLLPSWPAASLVLSHMCRLFCATLDDSQSTAEQRGVAIDFLGSVATRLHESHMRMRSLSSTNNIVGLNGTGRLHTIVAEPDNTTQTLLTLATAYEKLLQSLNERISADSDLASGAARFMEAQWAVEVGSLQRKVIERLENESIMANDEHNSEIGMLNEALVVIDASIQQIATNASRHLAPATQTDGKDRVRGQDADHTKSIQDLFEAVLHTFNYMIPSEYIQKKLVESSSGPVATNRSKALRALSAISQVDEEFLRQEEVRSAVQRCLLDESVHVRDGAVALLGRFVLANPAYMEPIFPSLRSKVNDTGLLVRKRTLRLLADIFRASPSIAVQVEAALEIVRGLHDQEPSLRDLAKTLIIGVWFSASPTKETPAARKADEFAQRPELSNGESLELESKVTTLVLVVDRLNTKHSALDEVLGELLQDESTQSNTQDQITVLVDEIANVIASVDEGQATIELVRYAKTLAFLLRHRPTALTVSHAKALLPHVHTCASSNELALLANILDIFSSSLIVMRKTALSFAQKLQDSIRPLVSQPSPHLPILPELVRCYALVVLHQTKDHAILVKTLQQCHRLMCNLVCRARSRKTTATAERNDSVIIRLTSLLVEHVDYDRIRDEEPRVAASIDEVTRRPIKEEMMTLLVRLFDNPSFVPHALYGMRFLFRAFPEFLLRPDVRDVCLGVLSSPSLFSEKAIVLRALSDILSVEEERKTASDQASGFGELVGTSDSLATPASYEVMQTYLERVLLLTHIHDVQPTILDILRHIVMRGLCHPMECLPSLVALETLVNTPHISSQAQQLHHHLIAKAGSNISFRYAICARASWELHGKLYGPNQARGCIAGAQSCFQPWYDTIADHQARTARMDFLKALMKSFDVRTGTEECKEEEIDLARFVAEALSTLDMRMMDEVQYIVDLLGTIMDVSGEHIRIFAMEEIEVDGEEERDEDEVDSNEKTRAMAFGRMATILTFAQLLRLHLMAQYGVSDQSSGRSASVGRASAKASNRIATRKRTPICVDWTGVPGAVRDRTASYRLAKDELAYFENLVSVEEYDDDE